MDAKPIPVPHQKASSGEASTIRSALLFDARCLTDPVAKVVQLGSPHRTPPNDLNTGDDWSVEWENPLNAYAESNLPNRDGFAETAPVASYHNTLECLDALAPCFHNANVHLHGVARVDVGEIVA